VDADAARPTIRLTWIAAAFGCAATALAAGIGADARWLAAVGALIVRAGALPHSIPYAAAPSEWRDAPALGQLVFHGLESLLGDKGLVLAQTVAVAVALVALALDLRRANARDGLGATVLIAVVVAAPATFLVVRAQLFSLALFPVLVLLLRSEAQRPSRRIWLAVPLLALWANLHGGVLVGFGVATAYLVLHRARHAPIVAGMLFVACTGALFATPALLGTAHYYAGVLGGVAASARYGLWAPLSLHEPLDLIFIVVALPLLAAAVRRRPLAWEVALLAALVVMSAEARRNGIWFLMFAATPAACGLRRTAATRPLLSLRLALVCACVPALMLGLGLARQPDDAGPSDRILSRAVALAHRTPILAEPLAAEQLALDGRRIWIGNPLEAFAPSDQRLYLDWLQGKPAGDAILREPINVVLVRVGSPAQRRIAGAPAFRERARDANGVLYTRRG
jgi:hypothetical protein